MRGSVRAGGTCTDPRAVTPTRGPDGGIIDADRAEGRLVYVRRLVVGGNPDAGTSLTTDVLGSWSTAPVEKWSASRLGREVYASCLDELAHPAGNTTERDLFTHAPTITITGGDAYHPGAPTTCKSAVALAHVALCTAENLVEISRGVTPYVSRALKLDTIFDGTSPHQFMVSPQANAANAAILEVAVEFGTLALTTSGENLRSGLGRYAAFFGGSASSAGASHADFKGVCDASSLRNEEVTAVSSSDPFPISWGETLTMVLSQSSQVVRESGLEAARIHVALGDAELSNNASRDVAARLAWVAPEYSRARGAHVLVGGSLEGGLAEVPYGYGRYGLLSSDARRALLLLRQSRYWPAEGLAAVDVDTLITNVAAKLSEGFSEDVDPLDSHDLLENISLDKDDWTAAKLYVADDVETFEFDSSTSVITDRGFFLNAPDVLTDSIALSRVRRTNGAAGIETLDDRPALAVTALGSSDTAALAGMPVGIGYANRSVAHAVDYAASVVVDLRKKLDPSVAVSGSDGFSDQTRAAMNRALAAIAIELSAERTARVESCGTTNTSRFRTILRGASGALGEYRLVVSEAGLRCAVRGSNHGEACQLADFLVKRTGTSDPLPVSTTTASGIGFGSSSYWEFDATREHGSVSTSVPWQHYYVVRSRRGAVAVGTELAGAFDEVAVVGLRAAGGTYCTYVPVVASIDRAAADAVTPSPLGAAEPAVSCVGLPSSQRIPLEDELTDDHDDVESSWRRYLTLARSAADEADRLGEQVVERGVDIERRVETATQEIEDECGGPLTVDWLTSVNAVANQPSCASSADGALVSGTSGYRYRCHGGMPVLDLSATMQARASTDPSASRIQACMGELSVEPIMALGSAPLCVWENPRTGSLCEKASELGVQCPAIMALNDTSASCMLKFQSVLNATNFPEPTTRPTTRLISQTLNVYSNGVPDDPTNTDPPAGYIEPPLAELRKLREGTGNVETLRGHSWMRLERLKLLASRIGWEGRSWDFSAITLDGMDWAATGDPYAFTAPANAGWPCGQALDVGACMGVTGDPALAPSLTCSRATTCTSVGPTVVSASGNVVDLVSRVRMNHRMARAVLALRVLTGVGLEGFSYPRVRVVKTDGTSNYQAQGYNLVEGTNDEAFIPSASGFVRAAMVSLGGITYTDYDGANASWSAKGSGACVYRDEAGTIGTVSLSDPRWLWTQLGDAYAGQRECTETCLRYPNSAGCDGSVCGRVFEDCSAHNNMSSTLPFYAPVIFTHETGPLLATNPQDDLDAVWRGVGGLSGSNVDTGGQGVDSLIYRVLATPVAEQDNVVLDLSALKKLSTYWNVDQNRGLDIAPRGLTARDVLDGLELAAMIDRGDTKPECAPERLKNMVASSASDLAQMETYFGCVADYVETQAQRMILRDVPTDVVVALRAGDRGQTEQTKGKRAAAASDIAATITRSRDNQLKIVNLYRDMQLAVSNVRLELDRNNVSRRRINIAMTRDIANQVAECMLATVTTEGDAPFSFGAKATIACANAAIQIGLAIADQRAQIEDLNLKTDLDLNAFSQRFQSSQTQLAQVAIDINADQLAAQSALTSMETSRGAATRSLSQAMLYSTDTAGRQLRVNTVLRRRFSTDQARYQRALDRAKRSAFLARLAIEQRLGMELSDLRQPMSLVAAPASWESSLCTLTGIDYAAIRSGQVNTGTLGTLDNYADQYVGEYVTNLENVVESYRLDMPFHEGGDQAVVSMRDQILNVRDVCPGPVSVANLLGHSGDLRGSSWGALSSCVPVNVTSTSSEIQDCYGINEIRTSGALGTLDGGVPVRSVTPEAGAARMFRVTFGPATNGGLTSARSASRLGQVVRLPAGRYMLSWYAGPATATDVLAGASAVSIRVDGVAPSVVTRTFAQGTTSTSTRIVQTFSLSRTADVEVAIRPSASISGSFDGSGVMLKRQSTVVGAFSLVSLEPALLQNPGASASTIDPPPFMATTTPGYSESGLPICEDTDGSKFRTGWRYDCMSLCADGFSRSCPPSQAYRYCYWERSFSITNDMLERNGGLERAGFAVGNFNYRISDLAVNFVGSGVRRCSGSTLPSQCYGSGYLLYTLEHQGPYVIRNASGEFYDAPLFVGRIERARGLASERYLTSPLSSADRTLIDPYERRELRGRPLTGTYVIRIWDTGDVNFEAIEDIQVLLGYRYWTRFQ